MNRYKPKQPQEFGALLYPAESRGAILSLVHELQTLRTALTQEKVLSDKLAVTLMRCNPNLLSGCEKSEDKSVELTQEWEKALDVYKASRSTCQ